LGIKFSLKRYFAEKEKKKAKHYETFLHHDINGSKILSKAFKLLVRIFLERRSRSSRGSSLKDDPDHREDFLGKVIQIPDPREDLGFLSQGDPREHLFGNRIQTLVRIPIPARIIPVLLIKNPL
jgi:hypothetical protein